MKELIYQVEFLSDIILPSSSNTQGNISQLDFIPGSNFLGMVATNYKDFEDSFKIFHSGAVKFGDATILKDGKPTYKMPLSYFYEKLDKNQTIYNHHKIDDFSKFNQLKQLRNNYITKDNETISIEYNYSQKSAYDKEKRRSLDSSMFGYSAIKSGTKWQFSIKVDETICEDDLKLLKKSILGTKRLGKSKSAQYGLVEIQELGTIENREDKNLNTIVLYANSRLALVDEHGNPTYDLQYLFDGLKKDNIDYPKSQIKTSTFTPYNSTRKTYDYERFCINKGSVIVLKDVDKSSIPQFVGGYQSEGFGELLLNPSFLNQHGFKLHKDNKEDCKEHNQEDNKEIKSKLALFLKQKEENKKAKLDILDKVDNFINKNTDLSKKKMNSQWGQIRSICSTSTNDTIYENIKTYITHGVAKTKWEGKNEKSILDAIKNSNKPLEFTKLVSILIPKKKEEK